VLQDRKKWARIRNLGEKGIGSLAYSQEPDILLAD
jgi:hypothetical protein